MLSILSTHPVQYQVPLWQALARDGRIPFEVWYLTDHGTRVSHDREFAKSFSWDLATLEGYPYKFLRTARDAAPNSFWGCRLVEDMGQRLRGAGCTALWIQGWQVAAYWQAAWSARGAGAQLWLRGESNYLKKDGSFKRPVKRVILSRLFSRVDRFLCIGTANRKLYEGYGVPHDKLRRAPYAVDNARFSSQAQALRPTRSAIRKAWGIADDAFCVLFCGKFISKKRPLDLVAAASSLVRDGILPDIHLLFVGSGQLGPELRGACDVTFDSEAAPDRDRPAAGKDRPRAAFAGFLNQTEISAAYVAADCLALPSDEGETWGLVVNEAMASGLPAVASRSCGCTEDLIVPYDGERAFVAGNVGDFARAIAHVARERPSPAQEALHISSHSIAATVENVVAIYRAMPSTLLRPAST